MGGTDEFSAEADKGAALHHCARDFIEGTARWDFQRIDQAAPSDVLGEQLGVSRTVIRDALADLEREGFISRTRGIGTVINRRVVNIKTRMDLEIEFMSLVADAGYTPKLDHSEMYIRDADKATAERLQLDVGEPVVACERSILADGRPIICAMDSVPKKYSRSKTWRPSTGACPSSRSLAATAALTSK